MAEIRLKISKHAQDKMLWLGISEGQVKDAISRGAQFRQTDGLLAKYRYLNVAYKKLKGDFYKVKTVYTD